MERFYIVFDWIWGWYGLGMGVFWKAGILDVWVGIEIHIGVRF